VEEWATQPNRTDRAEASFEPTRSTQSKDDYIATLEAEIRCMRGDKEKGSSSRAILVYDSRNRGRHDH